MTTDENRIITPVNKSWESWFNEEPASDDFMVEREQPKEQEHDPL